MRRPLDNHHLVIAVINGSTTASTYRISLQEPCYHVTQLLDLGSHARVPLQQRDWHEVRTKDTSGRGLEWLTRVRREDNKLVQRSTAVGEHMSSCQLLASQHKLSSQAYNRVKVASSIRGV